MSNPTKPAASVAEEVAKAHKAADDELMHRMSMNVLGVATDPLKAAIEKSIPERVDIHGRVRDGRAPIRREQWSIIPGPGRRS